MCRGPSPPAASTLSSIALTRSADRLAHRLQVFVAVGKGDPRRQRRRAALIEGIKNDVDQTARRGLVGADMLDGGVEGGGEIADHRPHQRRLQARGGAEMVDQVAVGDADLPRHRLQGHAVRTVLEQKAPRAGERLDLGFLGRSSAAARAPAVSSCPASPSMPPLLGF